MTIEAHRHAHAYKGDEEDEPIGWNKIQVIVGESGAIDPGGRNQALVLMS